MPVLRRLFSRRTLVYATGGAVISTGGLYWYLSSGPAYPLSTLETRRPPPAWTPPSRKEMLDSLKASGVQTGSNNNDDSEFDLLIVGGGATGAGIAVDAASRGLRVALVERDDFGAGSSLLIIFFDRCIDRHERYFVEEYKTGARWCPIPSKSRIRTRL